MWPPDGQSRSRHLHDTIGWMLAIKKSREQHTANHIETNASPTNVSRLRLVKLAQMPDL